MGDPGATLRAWSLEAWAGHCAQRADGQLEGAMVTHGHARSVFESPPADGHPC